MPEDTTQKETTFGARLKWAREQAGLTQGQAAKMLHFEKSEIIALETDQCGASRSLIEEFAVTYDVEINWLLLGTEREVDLSSLGSHVSAEDRESLRRVLARRRQDA